MKSAPWLALLAAAAGVIGCGPVPDTRSVDADLHPPLVQQVSTVGPGEICLEFDEEAALVPDKTSISPPLVVQEVSGPARQVRIRAGTQTPGRLYTLQAEARDARGNSASFMADFYGWNGRVPRVLINELTPRGSGNHPDLVELKTLTAGNLGGAVLYQGTPQSFDTRLVLPALEVAAGAFIIVHFKPTGDPSEVSESEDMSASRGLDSSDTAWDLWVPGGRGLAGNNGILSLYERPGGRCLDGVLYSNRTSESDERYRGFGSEEMRGRAEELVEDGGWKPAGPRVTPEDGISPEGSTGTRSICRSATSADTDTRDDWHIVPSRKATFGADNSDEQWTASSGATAGTAPLTGLP
jgi:hypothetical protein